MALLEEEMLGVQEKLTRENNYSYVRNWLKDILFWWSVISKGSRSVSTAT